jgi:hypothetical protein
MNHFLAISALLLLSLEALADPIPKSPGWSLSQIEQETEENSYGDGNVYFSLKPPDHRPAITIDYSTAKKLRSQEVKPEFVYSGNSDGEAVAEKPKGNENSVAKGGRAAGATESRDSASSESTRGGDVMLSRPQDSVPERRPAAVDTAPANMNAEQSAAWGDFQRWKASQGQDRSRTEAHGSSHGSGIAEE